MSLQRRIYEQNARLTEAPRDVDVKPNPETKKMIEGGKMKVVKSAPSYLGGKSIFAVLENPKAGREDDKYVMACISDPKRGAIKMFSYHGSHPSADGAMKFADKHGLTESVELEEAKSKDIVKGLTDMDGPFTVVAIKNNKVIKQEGTKMRNMLPAIVKMMRKEVGVNVTIGIEDRKGTIRGTFKEDVELTESFEFQFADKETAQKFMREISQKRLGSSTGTSDGKVRTEGPAGAGVGSPTRAHQQMAKIMKKYGGKILRTDEGPRMKRVFKEDFKPHMMYDPKTGKAYKAETYQDHLDMKEKGYGHDKPEVKEDTEQVDELSSNTLRSYVAKAKQNTDHNKRGNRTDGVSDALSRLDARSRLKRKADTSPEERAISKRLATEDIEQVDELKSDTLRSYRRKAQDDANEIARLNQRNKGPLQGRDRRDMAKRMAGKTAATSRLDARSKIKAGDKDPDLKRLAKDG